MNNKNILLITYAFPPNISIGARRWAKISKYLALKGYTIHVVTARSHWAKGDNWLEDIQSPNIKVYYVSDNQKKWLLEGVVKKSDYIIRFLRKFYIYYLEIIKGGLWMDEARFMKKNVLEKAIYLINCHKIKNVISTGPPFNINYFTAQLRNVFPDLNIMCDFRDSWTDAKNYAYENIPKYVIKAEEIKQRYTCENASFLFFTYKNMCEELKNKYFNILSEKFVHLSHAFDPDDYLLENIQIESNKLKIVFGGVIYMDACNTVAKVFINSLIKLRELDIITYNKLEIIFYNENSAFNRMVYENKLEDIISLKKHIPEKLFFIESNKADLLMTILGDNWKDYITSKNISHLGFKKPILMISNEGEASNFIRLNKLGYVLNNQNSNVFWQNLILDFESRRFQVDYKSFDNYTYKYLAERVESFFKK